METNRGTKTVAASALLGALLLQCGSQARNALEGHAAVEQAVRDSPAQEARERLERLGNTNVRVRVGDGYRGWPEAAPFDAIIVTAAPDHVPPVLLDQLREGGRMVLPLGRGYEQDLIKVRRTGKGLKQEVLLPVRFVPMVGEAQKPQSR